MSILSRLMGYFEKRMLDEKSGAGLIAQRGALSNLSLSGVVVTEENALQVSAVYACVRVLSESVAMLPLVLYRQNGRVREKALDHPLYSKLHDAPNDEMTSFDYRQVIMNHLCLRGNAYSYIEYDDAGRIVGLWPINPDSVQIVREKKTGMLLYAVQLPDKFGGDYIYLNSENVWHLRGLSRNGVVGYSPLRMAREAIGVSLAASGYGASFFSNNAEPGFVLIHPGKLSDEAYKRLRVSWEDRHKGFEKAHKIAILEEGMKPEKLGISPEDAQLLETRKFQISEIARIFRIPPHMIGDLDRATFSNIEHMGLEFVTYSLMPWLVNIEQSINTHLLLERERGIYYAKHTVAGLLRGDVESRYRAYATARQWGWMSINEIRELEEMNPLNNGDQYLTPLNMTLLDTVTDNSQRTQWEGMERRNISVERRDAAIKNRRRLMEEYQKVFSDAISRIYRRERSDILTAAKRIFKSRTLADFNRFLDDFYQEHKEYVFRNMLKVTETYGKLVALAAADEVGEDFIDQEAVQRFVKSYVDSFTRREEYDSRKRITQAINRAQKNGTDIVDELDSEMEDWDTTRADADGNYESSRANGAFSKLAWTLLGIAFITWVTSPGKNCPICAELDGKRIPISMTFVKAGDQLNQDGEPYTVQQDHAHPPLHDGCNCMIVAG